MATRFRPVRARGSAQCPACGEQIVGGVTLVMKRFQFGDWVHNRRSCLGSNVKQDPSP